MSAPRAAIVSFRLGGTDGVSIEAAKWQWALGQLGLGTYTVAGEGQADVIVPGLSMRAPRPPSDEEVSGALANADLVIVENLCSLPLNPAASDVLARALHQRPALLHHHDLPWQRAQFADMPPPPDDPIWAHVSTNDLSRRQLADRGIEATVIHNAFDMTARSGDREGARAALELRDGEVLVLQPTRAIERKNVPAGIALAEALGGTFWLLGPAEDGFESELRGLLDRTKVRVVHGLGPGSVGSSVGDAYAACDVVALPSTWEGFGNPSIESASYRRPLVIGDYPVAHELRAFGFRWFDLQSTGSLAKWLKERDESMLEHNYRIACRHFSLADLPSKVGAVLEARFPGMVDPRSISCGGLGAL